MSLFPWMLSVFMSLDHLGILSFGVCCSEWVFLCGFGYGLTGNKGIWYFIWRHLYCAKPKAVHGLIVFSSLIFILL